MKKTTIVVLTAALLLAVCILPAECVVQSSVTSTNNQLTYEPEKSEKSTACEPDITEDELDLEDETDRSTEEHPYYGP